MTFKNLDAAKHLDLPIQKHKNFFDPLPVFGQDQDKKPLPCLPCDAFSLSQRPPTPPSSYDVGKLRIIDTNHDGNYDKGVDKIVKVVPGEKEVHLSLGSKEVKEFEKKYKINLHSDRQFHLYGAKVYAEALDKARGQAADGCVEDVKRELEEAHDGALHAHIKWDGALEEGIVKSADLKGIELALQNAELASANGYVGETRRWLEKAGVYAEEAAILGDRKTLDPKFYDPHKVEEIGQRAYRIAIEKRLAIAQDAGARGDVEIYGHVASEVFRLAKEGKEKYGLEIHPVLPPLMPPNGNFKIQAEDFLSYGEPKLVFYDEPMKQADCAAQSGDYKLVDAYLAQAEQFMIEHGAAFNEEEALSIKSVANQIFLEQSVLSFALVY